MFRSLICFLTLSLGSGASFAQSPLANLLSVEPSENEVTLSWPGGEPLFSSTDLSEWDEIQGATSPLTRGLAAGGREFFSLRLFETEALIPVANAIVGTQSIPVNGTISSALRGTEGLTVTISASSSPVEIVRAGNGAETFVLDGRSLSIGSNTLTVTASNAAGLIETSTIQVTYDPITANNVVIRGDFAYCAEGASGLAIIDLRTRTRTQLSPSRRVDDLSIDGDLLFTLDASNSGARLTSFSLTQNPAQPEFISTVGAIPVGPFTGVSAAGGRVVVSGGTSLLTVRSYTTAGVIQNLVSSIDLGIGQPDVLISSDGERAFVSTDFSGTFNGAGFGLTTIDITNPPTSPTIRRRQGLVGSGFTALGFGFLANFPVESAQIGSTVLVAFDQSLAILSDEGVLQRTVSLGFSATNVDAVGDHAFVVGVSGSSGRLAEIDLSDITSPSVISNQTFTGSGPFSGVAANDDYIVIAANGSGLQILDR